MASLSFQSEYEVPVERLSRWLGHPRAFERLLPAWWPWRLHVDLEEDAEAARLRSLDEGADLDRPAPLPRPRVYRLELGPSLLQLGITLEQRAEPGASGRILEQTRGPFADWRHVQHVAAATSGPESELRSTLEERVDFALGWGGLGERQLRGQLARAARFRSERAALDLERLSGAAEHPQRIAISGASGGIGSELVAFLEAGGHRVDPLVRRAPRPGSREIRWDPARGELDARSLEGLDALVHLAGRGIAALRWSAGVRSEIMESRVRSTRLLAERLASLERPPRVWVVASAIGFYGDRGDLELDEASPAGDGFLAEVCGAWEAAVEPARAAGIRVVTLRLGIVLSPRSGALASMLPAFRAGVGGVLGSGAQWMSWISLDDVVGAVAESIFRTELDGAVNVVAPAPVTQGEFAAVLARVLRRPARFPVPAGLIRAGLGEMGQALLLASTRVRPGALQARKFRFAHPELECALRFMLGHAKDRSAPQLA